MSMRPTISYKPQGFSLVPKKGVIARLPLKMPSWCLKLWDARRRLLPSCVFLWELSSRTMTMNDDHNSKNFSTYLSKLWAVPVSIALALLIFQSIWLAYGIGLLIVAMKASTETRKRVEQLTESHESLDGLQCKAKLGEATGITERVPDAEA